MTLIAINKPNEGVVWVNPEHVLSVRETNIGHVNQGVIGTAIEVAHLTTVETKEAIESVIQRLQG